MGPQRGHRRRPGQPGPRPNLPPAAASARGVARPRRSAHGVPFYATLHQLSRLPVADSRRGNWCTSARTRACCAGPRPSSARRAPADLRRGPGPRPPSTGWRRPSPARTASSATTATSTGLASPSPPASSPGTARVRGASPPPTMRPPSSKDAASVALAGTRQPTPWDPPLGE